MENLTNDTPPKKGFWTPLRTVRFPPPSGVSALFFPYKNPRQSRPKALLEGSGNFREGAFSATFSSPHTFCTPPYHGNAVFIWYFGILGGFSGLYCMHLPTGIPEVPRGSDGTQRLCCPGIPSAGCPDVPASPGSVRGVNPSHLRPVILKPVGRIFEISDSNPIQGKCGKCGRPSHPRKTRV